MNIEALTGKHPGGKKYYKQLLELQDDMFVRAMRETTDNSKAAACVRAWEVLEERKRIMRGKLKAGSLNESRRSVAEPTSRPKRVKGDVVVLGDTPAVVSDNGVKPSEDGPRETL